MSQGPDNYIWQSYEEWLSNVIAKNYPFSSISGCPSFSEGWYFKLFRGMVLHFCAFPPPPPLGLFPGGRSSYSSLPLVVICILLSSLQTPSPLLTYPPQPPFCPHNSFRSPMVEVEGMRMLDLQILRGQLLHTPGSLRTDQLI